MVGLEEGTDSQANPSIAATGNFEALKVVVSAKPKSGEPSTFTSLVCASQLGQFESALLRVSGYHVEATVGSGRADFEFKDELHTHPFAATADDSGPSKAPNFV